jgi:hypothetical protein
MYELRAGVILPPTHHFLSSNPRAIEFLKQNPQHIDERYIWTNPGAEKLVQGAKVYWDFLAANPADWALDLLEKEGHFECLFDNTNPRAAKHFTLTHFNVYSLCENHSEWAVEILKQHKDRIIWSLVSANPFAMDLLLENPDKIDWPMLSQNSSSKAIELLKANPDKIDWCELCSNDNPEAIIMLRKAGPKFWNFEYLSYNKSRAGLELLLENPEDPCIDWIAVTYNKYIFKLTRRSICEGPVDTKEWAWEYPREYLVLQVFRRRLMRAYLDPVYKLCRTRLNREFSSL